MCIVSMLHQWPRRDIWLATARKIKPEGLGLELILLYLRMFWLVLKSFWDFKFLGKYNLPGSSLTLFYNIDNESKLEIQSPEPIKSLKTKFKASSSSIWKSGLSKASAHKQGKLRHCGIGLQQSEDFGCIDGRLVQLNPISTSHPLLQPIVVTFCEIFIGALRVETLG